MSIAEPGDFDAADAAFEAERSADLQGGEAAPARRKRAYLPAKERRQLIIQAAQEVFARANLQGARTRDIAKAADVNQATLFEHFESKKALFHEAVVEPLLEAMRGMQDRAKAYEAATNAEEMIEMAQVSTQRHLTTMIEIFPLMTAALFSDPELGRKLYCEQIAPLLQARGEAIRAITRDSLDLELVDLAHFGMFFAVAMDQFFRAPPRDMARLAQQVTSIAALGFAKDREPS